MRAFSRALTVTALGVAGALAFAAPASAAVAALPESDTIFAVDCQEDIGQLLSVDSTTAEFARIGTGTATEPKVDCAGPSAYDASTGTAYWISWNANPSASLMTVDLTTGVSTFVGDFVDAANDHEVDAGALAIDPAGNAFFIGRDDVDGGAYNRLYSLDLATAEVNFIAELTDGVDERSWWSFAFNPANSTYYGIADGGGIYSVDITTGAITSIAAWGDLQHRPYGIAFDSDGAMWGFTDDIEAGEWGLFSTSVTAAVADYQFIGVSMLGGTDYFSESIFLVTAPEPEKPVLAATGVEGAAANGILLAGGLLLAGALALAARARFTREA